MAALFKKKPTKPEGLPPAAGDIAIRAYRKNTKDPRKKKERTAFEDKLKSMAGGYKSKKVP